MDIFGTRTPTLTPSPVTPIRHKIHALVSAPHVIAAWLGEPILHQDESGPTLLVGELTDLATQEAGERLTHRLTGGHVPLDASEVYLCDIAHSLKYEHENRTEALVDTALSIIMGRTEQPEEDREAWSRIASPYSPLRHFSEVAFALLAAVTDAKMDEDLKFPVHAKPQVTGLHRFPLSGLDTSRIVISTQAAPGKAQINPPLSYRSAVINAACDQQSVIELHTFTSADEQLDWHVAQLPDTWARADIRQAMDLVISGMLDVNSLI